MQVANNLLQISLIIDFASGRQGTSDRDFGCLGRVLADSDADEELVEDNCGEFFATM